MQKVGKTPRYVSSFTDNRGVLRYRFRKQGHKQAYFKTPHGTAEFDAEYRALLRGETIAPIRRARETGPRIYFISAGLSRIKIGWTNNIGRRMKELQIGAATRLALVACIPGTKDDEAMLHARFAALRVRGEWFRCTAELMATIRRIKDANCLAPLSSNLAGGIVCE